MTTVEQLTQVFNDNFMAYLRSHIAHVNIVGRNFQSDHALLNGIYDDLQDQIDYIAELLRSLQAFMPDSIDEITGGTHISTAPIYGTSETLLGEVLGDLEHLVECYAELIEVAEEEDLDNIANYAQDRITTLTKHIWMLRSTLE